MNHTVLAESYFWRLGHSPAMLICLGVAAVLIIALIRVISRGKGRRHHRHARGHHWRSNDESKPAAEPAPQAKSRSKRHLRRRRALNPTLAETRGLPPAREEPGSSPPPY